MADISRMKRAYEPICNAEPDGTRSSVTLPLTDANAGLPNYSYHVLVVSNLASNLWTDLAANPAHVNCAGLFIFTDASMANSHPRFCRFVSP
jgi:hypothetical protein